MKYTDVYNNTIGYDYDEVGKLITLTYPDDQTVQYEYDANNRLTQVTDWENRVTVYTYDNNGRLKTTTRPDGSAETRTYAAAGQLLQISDLKADQTVINQLDYTYDAVGNLTAETRTDPAGTVTYEYDELNRMTEYTDVYSNTLQYDYDEAGNITAETTLQPPGSTVMTYGADNRLDTYNGQPVTYEEDGNMTYGALAGDMVNFTFDSRSRLTGAGDTSYTYDANNNRVSDSDSVYQTNYTVNPNAPLSQVLTATDEPDNKTYFVYGLGLIGQEETGGNYRTYHYDLRGSTVALTDENGNVTDRFQYAQITRTKLTTLEALQPRSICNVTENLLRAEYGLNLRGAYQDWNYPNVKQLKETGGHYHTVSFWRVCILSLKSPNFNYIKIYFIGIVVFVILVATYIIVDFNRSIKEEKHVQEIFIKYLDKKYPDLKFTNVEAFYDWKASGGKSHKFYGGHATTVDNDPITFNINMLKDGLITDNYFKEKYIHESEKIIILLIGKIVPAAKLTSSVVYDKEITDLNSTNYKNELGINLTIAWSGKEITKESFVDTILEITKTLRDNNCNLKSAQFMYSWADKRYLLFYSGKDLSKEQLIEEVSCL